MLSIIKDKCGRTEKLFGKIFLDTNPIIYILDKNQQFYQKTKNYITSALDEECLFYTSVITDAEFLVVPLRLNDINAIKSYHELINDLSIYKVNINEQIAKRAALIRATHKGIKLGDSLQLGACIEYGCDVFLTNDGQLRQVKEVNVVYIGEL